MLEEDAQSKGVSDVAGASTPHGNSSTSVEEQALFRRAATAESSRRWGLIRGHIAVTPVSPSKGNPFCDVVDASTGGRLGSQGERWNVNQQLWQAARDADPVTVARLLFGEEAKLVLWQATEGKWRVRMTEDGSERLVPPSQLVVDVMSSRRGSKSSSDYGTTCGGTASCTVPSRGSTRESVGCRGSPTLSAADVAGVPTPAPRPHPLLPAGSGASSSRGMPPSTPLEPQVGLARCGSVGAMSTAASVCGGIEEASTAGSVAGWNALGAQPGTCVRVLLANVQQARVDWEMHRDKSEALVYKNRRMTSQALHAAVAPRAPRTDTIPCEDAEFSALEKELKENVRKVVYLLLQARADASAVAKVDNKSGNGQPSRELQAIHMAAGAGDAEVIRMLVNHRADVQAPAKSNGEYHYVPLHDAVWFDQRSAARTLVELHANVDAKNGKGETPLHLAAHLGHVEMVAALLLLDDGRELLRRTCNKKWTPLDVALQSARFPPRKLYLFTHKMCAKDKAEAFLKVARICPMVAPELLRDDSVPLDSFQEKTISKAWRENLQEAAEKHKVITAQHLASLVEVAPLAAVELVDALTATPPVEDSKHHPLPFRANVPLSGEACRLSCAYVPDSIWHWYAEGELTGKAVPAWHAVLAPENPKYGQEVEIKILKLPGVLNLDLMHVLAVTSEHVIFSKLAIHAVLRCAWNRTRWIHSIELLIQGAAMICMVLWVVCPELGRLGERLLWCIVAAEAASECLLIGAMTRRCISLLGVRKWSQWASRMVLRCILAVMNLALAVETADTMRPQNGDMLFATSALLHWVHFLWELRTFKGTGKRLLPMMRALMLLGGMLVVLFFLTVAFLHAFWAMAGDALLIWDLFSVLKLLFTGEVDEGIDPISFTVPHDQKVFLCILGNGAIIVFLVCFVNLFIAVLSDNYQAEQERLIFTLFRERAHVCCNLFLAPRFGGHWVATALSHGYHGRYVIGLFVAACLVGSLIWVAMVFTMLEEELPGFVAVSVAGVGILVLQGCVRGYLTCDFTDACHLWVCHDKCFEEGKLLLTEDQDFSGESQGRIARLRGYIHEQIKLVGMSMKVTKNLLLKRHTEQEMLIGQIFHQLNDLRGKVGGTAADMLPPLGLGVTPQGGKLNNQARASLKRIARLSGGGSAGLTCGLSNGSFVTNQSEMEKRRQHLRGNDALRENAKSGANTPGRGMPTGSTAAGAESEVQRDVEWPKDVQRLDTQSAAQDLRERIEEMARLREAETQEQRAMEEAARSLKQGLGGVEQLGSLQEAGQSADVEFPASAREPEERSVVAEPEERSVVADDAAVQGLREEIHALRADLLQRDQTARCMREDMEALREDLRQQREQGELLRRSAAGLQTLCEDVTALRADVQRQRAEGQELRALVEQVLLKFDGALVAAATGQEILRHLPPELRQRPRAPAAQSADEEMVPTPVFAPRTR